jgi:hypothetical protein
MINNKRMPEKSSDSQDARNKAKRKTMGKMDR